MKLLSNAAMDGCCTEAVRLVTPGFSAVDCHHHGHGGSAAAGSPAMASFASRTSGSASACPRAHQRPTTCGHARVRHLASYLHRRPEVPRESPSHPLAFWLTLLVDRPSTFVQFKSTASRAPATAVLIPPVPTHVICVALSSDCSVLATSACHPQTAMFGRVRRTRPASPVRVALGHYYLHDINAA